MQCEQEAWEILADPGALLDNWPPGTPASDRELMAEPDIRARFAAALAETASRVPAGEFLDTLLNYITPWGFRPGNVQPPVQIWHGMQDPFVPVAIAWAMATRIPGSSLAEYPGEGQTVDYRHIGEVLTTLAAAR